MLKNINLNKLTIFLLLFSNIIYAQSILVTGKVVDKQGQPLPGVSILLKDSSTGTSTSFEGNYALKVSTKEDVLQFSYIGFDTQNIIVGDQSQIDIILEENLESLDEVQVVQNWEVYVRRVYDTEDIQIYITGSSAKLLSTEIAFTESRKQSTVFRKWHCKT